MSTIRSDQVQRSAPPPDAESGSGAAECSYLLLWLIALMIVICMLISGTQG